MTSRSSSITTRTMSCIAARRMSLIVATVAVFVGVARDGVDGCGIGRGTWAVRVAVRAGAADGVAAAGGIGAGGGVTAGPGAVTGGVTGTAATAGADKAAVGTLAARRTASCDAACFANLLPGYC